MDLTRREIEVLLSRKYLGKVIIITLPDRRELCGKIGRITCETAIQGEPMVIFTMNGLRHEVDVNYFVENSTIQKQQ